MNNEAQILVTGGTGNLGKALCSLLAQAGIAHTIASRNNNSNLNNWQHIDLTNGSGIAEATRNKKIIFNLASGTHNFNKKTDVYGTHMLLEAAAKNNVEHFIHISIVGIDKIPYSYYEYKLGAEHEIKQAKVPYTILRATQFHDLVDFAFSKVMMFPLNFIPKKIPVQPVDVNTVAEKLFALRTQQPINQTINIGGPEVLTTEQLLNTWKTATQKTALTFNLPLRGKLGSALHNGNLTCAEKTNTGLTWDAWLRKKYN